jgi:hypothetical protein
MAPWASRRPLPIHSSSSETEHRQIAKVAEPPERPKTRQDRDPGFSGCYRTYKAACPAAAAGVAFAS